MSDSNKKEVVRTNKLHSKKNTLILFLIFFLKDKKVKSEILEIKNNLTNFDFCEVKSETQCWKKFKVAVNKDTKSRFFSDAKPGHCFVKCNDCDKIYVYSSKTGNTQLNRHGCRETTKTRGLLQAATSEQKVNVNKKLTIACIVDARPFELVAGDGFLDFVQELIDTAQESDHPIDARSLIYHPTTISRHVHEIKEQCTDKLTIILQGQEKQKIGIAFSTDIWTDSTNKVYFQITIIKNHILKMALQFFSYIYH